MATYSWFRAGMGLTTPSEHNVYGSEAIPERIFKEDVDIFYETMETTIPGAWNLNLEIQELWHEIDGAVYDWRMPDNFYCCIETHEKEIVNFRFLDRHFSMIQKVNRRPCFHKALGPNLIHSIDGMIVREMYRRCQYNTSVKNRILKICNSRNPGTKGKSANMVQTLWDLYQESGFLSARILDFLYEDTIGLVDRDIIIQLVQSLPKAPFQLMAVHDCFRCHPNYGNDLRRQYNIIMADINDSNLLSFITSQITGQFVIAKKESSIPREVILNGNYLLA